MQRNGVSTTSINLPILAPTSPNFTTDRDFRRRATQPPCWLPRFFRAAVNRVRPLLRYFPSSTPSSRVSVDVSWIIPQACTMASTTPSSSAASVTTYTIPTITSYVNLGPLPTTVKFPPDCQTDVYDFDALGIGVPWTYYTQGCALSTCCPSGHVYSTAFEWYSKYYSPAVCPYGYTPGPMDPIISTSSNENARWCCPTLVLKCHPRESV